MYNISKIVILLILWDAQPSVSDPSSSLQNSPLFREMEAKKSLYYYNKTPMLRQPQSGQGNTGEVKRHSTIDSAEQTPAQDKLYFPPYKFPFWGLPYGIYSKGGFFNPGLFPFVPGGPGFPPYDGVFGGPAGPGKFPGPSLDPFQNHQQDLTASASGGGGDIHGMGIMGQPGLPGGMGESGQGYYPGYPPRKQYNTGQGAGYGYQPRKKAQKKKKAPPPPQEKCKCDGYDDDDDDAYSCKCPTDSPPSKPKDRPRYNRAEPKKPAKKPPPANNYYGREPKSKKPASPRRPCRYGYSSGPNGGCKPKPTPEPEQEEEDAPPGYEAPPSRCGKYRTKGKCPKARPSRYPSYSSDQEEDDSDAGDDDDSYSSDDDQQVVPQFIPYFLGYQPYPTPEPTTTTTTTPAPPASYPSQPQQQQYQPALTMQYVAQPLQMQPVQYNSPSTPTSDTPAMVSVVYSSLPPKSDPSQPPPQQQQPQQITIQALPVQNPPPSQQPQMVQNAQPQQPQQQQVAMQYATSQGGSNEPNIAMIYAGTSEGTQPQSSGSQAPILIHYIAQQQSQQQQTPSQPPPQQVNMQYQSDQSSSDTASSSNQHNYIFQTVPMKSGQNIIMHASNNPSEQGPLIMQASNSQPQRHVFMQQSPMHTSQQQNLPQQIFMQNSNPPTPQVQYTTQQQPFEIIYKPPGPTRFVYNNPEVQQMRMSEINYRPQQQQQQSSIMSRSEPLTIKYLGPIFNNQDFQSQESGRSNNYEIASLRPFDQYTSASSPQMNLHSKNSEESPSSFISNHLNNYTASNFHSENKKAPEENTENSEQEKSDKPTPSTSHRNEKSVKNDNKDAKEKVTTVVSVSTSTSESEA